jgi:hypothetical protein
VRYPERVKARWAIGVVIATMGVACALDIPDVIDGGSDGGIGDASDAGDVFVPPVCDAQSACGAPSGFGVVLFDPAGTTPCPAQTSPADVVYDAGAVPSSACGCSCAVNTQPSCIPATIAVMYDTTANATCNGSGSLSNLTGGCDPASYALGNHAALEPFKPADAGTCTSTPTPDTKNIPVSRGRVCSPTQCNSPCTSSGPFKLCYMAPGDMACPQNQTAYHVGTSLALACSPCAACTMTGQCSGTVSFYSDGACGALIRSNTVDGVCTMQSQVGQSVSSQKYVPSIDAGCTPGSPGTGTVSLATPLTVCCP